MTEHFKLPSSLKGAEFVPIAHTLDVYLEFQDPSMYEEIDPADAQPGDFFRVSYPAEKPDDQTTHCLRRIQEGDTK
jgi:hypothetical protein